MKIREWFKDKWAWLLTFNNPPEVTIKAEKAEITNKDSHFIYAESRVKVIIDIDYLNLKTKEHASKV